MTAKKALLSAGCIAGLCVFALFATAWQEHRAKLRTREDAAYEAGRRLNRFCDSVRDGFMQDANDLRSDFVEQREHAADRFLEPVTFHSWEDVTLCSGGDPAVDKSRCWLKNDFECIAKQAEFVASMIPVAAADDQALLRLRERCKEVHWAMDEVASECRPGRVARPEDADRLGTHFVRLSKEEIEMCAPVPPDLRPLDECRARKDYACIERIATAAERAISIEDE